MCGFTFNGPYGEMECVVNNYAKNDVVLIMAHGFRGSRDGGGGSVLLAERLSETCKVVRFNFNGSQILSRQIAELQAIVQEVRQRYEPQKIFLLGRSLGGAASLVTASADKAVAGLILWATPNNLRKTFWNALGEELYNRLDAGETLPLEDERGKLALTPDFLTDIDQYDLSALAGAWQDRPLLIVHGEKDVTVNVEQAQQNYALAGGEKELHIFASGDHSLAACADEVNDIICSWLQKYK